MIIKQDPPSGDFHEGAAGSFGHSPFFFPSDGKEADMKPNAGPTAPLYLYASVPWSSDQSVSATYSAADSGLVGDHFFGQSLSGRIGPDGGSFARRVRFRSVQHALMIETVFQE